MFLTEWFGNGYVGNAAPNVFYVRPGVALDERGARLHKINTDQRAKILRKLGYRSATFKMSVLNPQRGDRRDWHILVGKRVNKTKTFKQLNDAVFATRQWRDIEFGHAPLPFHVIVRMHASFSRWNLIKSYPHLKHFIRAKIESLDGFFGKPSKSKIRG